KVFNIHLAAMMLPVITHREIRRLTRVHLDDGEGVRMRHYFAKLSGHKPADAQSMQQFGDGVTRSVIRSFIVSSQYEKAILAMDDKAFLAQLRSQAGGDLKAGQLGGELAGANEDQRSRRS